MRWSDLFTLCSRELCGFNSSIKSGNEQTIWVGCFHGQPLCIFSTVRMIVSHFDHFSASTNVYIHQNLSNLHGDDYLDLRVLCERSLSSDELFELGWLARTEDQRVILIRQGKESLSDGLLIPFS